MLSTDHCDQMSSTVSFCTGDSGFKSCPGKLLPIKFVVFLNSFSHILDTSDLVSFHSCLNLLLAIIQPLGSVHIIAIFTA